MDILPESVLLKIFSYIPIDKLFLVSRVNHDWNRVAHDWRLWQVVNLARYSKNIPDLTLRKLIRNVLSFRLKKLDLTNFNVTTKTLQLLSKNCPALTTLILKYSTIYESYRKIHEIEYFPRNLKTLNIAHSTGLVSVYKNIMTSLENNSLEWLSVTDDFLKLFYDSESTFLKFFLRERNSMKVLEFCFCRELTDDCLMQILNCSRNLVSLCVQRCQNVRGEFLQSIFAACPQLRSLDLKGSLMEDDNLKGINWSQVLLENLDLSWCRNITEDTLLHMLPSLKFLQCLRVSCCGYGHALTDAVLRKIARKPWSFLRILDVSYSFELTEKGLNELLHRCPTLRDVFKSNCPNILE